jgi:nucleoside-diphosphate-sugar epimerase
MSDLVHPPQKNTQSSEAPRVLITGLQGFTGRYMAAELENYGYEVWGIGTESPNEPRILCADLTDPSSISKAVMAIQPQYVIHLAGIAFVEHGIPNAFYNVNLLGTRNLIGALEPLAQNLKCVLLASSANVYGNLQSGMLDERNETNPANDYAVSKLAMEYMAKLWLPRIPIVIARPFNYTGAGQSTSFLIPKIVSHFARKEQTIELGNMDVWREFNDVRDVVFAYRKLIEAAPVGQTINICSGNLLSLRNVLELAEAMTQSKIQAKVNPTFVRINEVLKLGGDPSLLKKFVPHWQPRSLSETLAWMLDAARTKS